MHNFIVNLGLEMRAEYCTFVIIIIPVTTPDATCLERARGFPDIPATEPRAAP